MFFMRRRQGHCIFALWLAVLVFALPVAGGVNPTPREAAEEIVQAFAGEVGDASVEAVAGRLERLVATCGDDAVGAARLTGFRGMTAMEQSTAEDGPVVARLIARHGEVGLRLAGESENVKLFRQFGDEAVTLLLAQTEPATDVDVATTNPADATNATNATLAARPDTPSKETDWLFVIGLCTVVLIVWLVLRTWLLFRQRRRR